MEQGRLAAAIDRGNVEWSAHGLRRMFQRGIKTEFVKRVIKAGTVIEEYPDDKPFPSALFHGICENKPLHVVAAFDSESDRVFVITAYWPDEEHFEGDLRTRRTK